MGGNMKKSKILDLIKSASVNTNIINAYFSYDPAYYNLIPLTSNSKLFLAIKEDDFIFNGYSIYRFKDLDKVRVKNDMCDKILKDEGLTSNIIIPSIDINSWESVFESLMLMKKNIIIEKQASDDQGFEYVLGRVYTIHRKFAYVWKFDANGVWNERPTKVPYSKIRNITFGSRYVDTFSKYLGKPPLID